MMTQYGDLPKDCLENYFDMLINRTYKILPMKEEGSSTLKSYLNSYLCELIGDQTLMFGLKDEPQFVAVLGNISYLANEEYDVGECKRMVFNCINLLKSVRKNVLGEA